MMGGWWRLWVVCSVILGALFFVIQSGVHDVSDYRSGMTREDAQRWVNEGTIAVQVCRIAGVPKVTAEPSTDGSYNGYYSCASDRQRILAFAWALVPGALLAVLGLTLRWIWRGFRRNPA